MRIENLEQRVAKAPASLLCDECMHQQCCEYRESMKRVVVQTNDNCKPYPFKPEGWYCKFYMNAGLSYPDNVNYIQDSDGHTIITRGAANDQADNI